MKKENPAATLARLRWKGIDENDRKKEMTRVANEGWKTRRKKGKMRAHVDKTVTPIQNVSEH